MANQKKLTAQKIQTAATAAKNIDREVEVLYQRLGDRVFAFSLVDDEVFFGEVPNDAIEAAAGALNPPDTDTGHNV